MDCQCDDPLSRMGPAWYLYGSYWHGSGLGVCWRSIRLVLRVVPTVMARHDCAGVVASLLGAIQYRMPSGIMLL